MDETYIEGNTKAINLRNREKNRFLEHLYRWLGACLGDGYHIIKMPNNHFSQNSNEMVSLSLWERRYYREAMSSILNQREADLEELHNEASKLNARIYRDW